MQNNTIKIVAGIITILVIGGVSIFAMNSNTSISQPAKELMSKTSDVMKKTEDTTKMAVDKMTMEKEAMMKKDAISKSSDVMIKADNKMKMESKSSWTPEEMKAMGISSMSMDDKMLKEEDSISKDRMMKAGEVSSPKGMYSQYSVTNLAQNSTGTNVIFFHAPWCPSCKSIDKDITANLNKLPEGFQILKADFDTSTVLKQKYGITSQSTFVKVDKDGNKIGEATKAFALTTVSDIIAFGSK